ncbi:unnamed protein product [Gadus morhua 'NCC']
MEQAWRSLLLGSGIGRFPCSVGVWVLSGGLVVNPVSSSLTWFTVSSHGTSIIQVTATDADDPTYGNSARLVYTLVQGQQYFSVDPQTGTLRTAVPDLDRESQDQFLVVLQAKDMGGHLGGLSGTATVTIRLTDVNDNPPRFTQSEWRAPPLFNDRTSASDHAHFRNRTHPTPR